MSSVWVWVTCVLIVAILVNLGYRKRRVWRPVSVPYEGNREGRKIYPPVGTPGLIRLWLSFEDRRRIVGTQGFQFGDQGATPECVFEVADLAGALTIECGADWPGIGWAFTRMPNTITIAAGLGVEMVTVGPSQIWITST